MSIAHELSSEVAAAVLADGEGGSRLDAGERAEVVLEVHSTLRRLSAEYRRRGRAAKGEPGDPPLGEGPLRAGAERRAYSSARPTKSSR